jgi:hypothetical protein
MTITRRNAGSGHSYTIDGRKVPGVTTILGNTLPKQALLKWSAESTASYAVDHWAELTELPPSARLKELFGARFKERDAAAKRGTDVHRLAEQLVAGVQVDVPDELAGHVESYVDFLNTWDPAPVLVEAVVGNRAVEYCGTLDLVADLRGVRWLLDVKTSRSGIFGETALQCTAYSRAEVYAGPDGAELPLPELGIERVGAVHVRSDGWDLRPLEAGDDVWSYFRHLAWLNRNNEQHDTMRDWVGAAVEPIRAVS